MLSSMSPLGVVCASIYSPVSFIALAGRTRGQSPDISIVPKPIAYTFEQAGIRDAERNGRSQRTSRETRQLVAPADDCAQSRGGNHGAPNAQKESFGSLPPILSGSCRRDLRQQYIYLR